MSDKYRVEIRTGVYPLKSDPKTWKWMSIDKAQFDTMGKRYSEKEAQKIIDKAIKAGRLSHTIRMVKEGEKFMNKEDKYLNEEKKYKIQIKDLKGKWVDQTPKGKYSKSDAELIMKKEIKRGKHADMIKIVQESVKYNENKMKTLIGKDNFLNKLYKKGTDLKTIFNTYVIGDSVLEKKYLNEDLDVLEKIELEELIRETKEFLDDDELSEKALATAGWTKGSIEKFGKTIGVSPGDHGFIKACVSKMKGKSGWDEKKAGGFCASMVDKIKGGTGWRKGPRG